MKLGKIIIISIIALLFFLVTPTAASAETYFWESNSTVRTGLTTLDVGDYPKPDAFYNLFGDEKWHLLIGEDDGLFYGFHWNGSSWVTNNTVKSGLLDTIAYSNPDVFYNLFGDEKWHAIIGGFEGTFSGYHWTGSTWASNTTIVNGLGDMGSDSTSNTFYNFFGDGIWHLIAIDSNTNSYYSGYDWNGTGWSSNSTIINGLGIPGYPRSEPEVIYNLTGDETWSFICGGFHGWIYAWHWNGSTWIENTTLVAGISDVGQYSHPVLFYDFFGEEKWHILIGSRYGYISSGYEWAPDITGPQYSNANTNSTIFGEPCLFSVTATDNFLLHDDGQYIFATNNTGVWVNESLVNFTSTPQTIQTVKTLNSTIGKTVGWRIYGDDNAGNIEDSPIYTLITAEETFIPPDPTSLANTTGNYWVNHTYTAGSGNVTHSFNVSVNGTWYNGTTALHFNDTYSAHDWQNITVWAYNSSGLGTLSTGNASQNTQIPNNPITITNTSDWNGKGGETVYVDYDRTDLDSDSPTFSCNRTDLFTDFNTSTGEGSFLTSTETIYYVDFGVADNYDSTDNYTMTITVSPAPANPVNLANSTDDLWINHTWENGTGVVTDSYNVSANDVWTNGSTNTFFNDTYSGHGWQNITVWAYNSTLNTLSGGSVNQNTQLLNNNITITNTSNWAGATGDNVYVDFDAADLDSDTPTFSCNRTDLFTDFNTTTGQGNWTAIDGVTYVNFGVSDGYGSTDNYTMTIMGNVKPDNPEDLFISTDDFWMNHSWLTGGQWYLLSGEIDGAFFGYNWTGSAWQTDDVISSGLVDIGTHSTPSAFYMNDTWYLISGIYHGIFTGYSWTGSTWQSDTNIISGLVDVGQYSKLTVFNMDGTWHLIASENGGTYDGYHWTGSTWQSNATIISGLGNTGAYASANVFQKDNEWYLITQYQGRILGFNWTGSAWQSYTEIENGFGDIGNYATPNIFQKAGIWYLIAGQTTSFYGFNWTDSAWQSDSAIISGLGDPGSRMYPFAFYMTTGNTTDSYNVSVNDVWYNGTTNTFYNDTYSPHEWQNITVYAYNSTGSGTLSAGSISQNSQLPNNPITITNTSDWDGAYSDNVYVDFDATDLDSDTPTFSCDRTDLFTDFDTATGRGNWTAVPGTYYVDFGVSDGYGSTDNYTMPIEVSEPFTPPDPINLANTTGDFWINHTWEKLPESGASIWYLLEGDANGGLSGFNWSGSTWQSDSTITSGLPSFGSYATPEAFDKSDTTYLFVGNLTTSTIYGYNWNGSSWIVDNVIASGLTGFSTSNSKKAIVFEIGGVWHTIVSITGSPPFYGYDWTGSAWQSNSTIISGLPTSYKFFPASTVFEINSTWYLIFEDITGTIYGYNWTGTTWQTDNAILSGYPSAIISATPYVFQKDGIHYLMVGDSAGAIHGHNWTGSAWQVDSTISGGLGSTGNSARVLSVFEIDEPILNVVDSYNVSVNDVWYNGTTNTFYNDTYSPHEWQNITVYAYNSTDNGALSENSISQNTQLSNNPITLTNVSASYSLNEGETFTLDANYTDLDSDIAVFSDNSSNWTINSATGEVSWLTDSSDIGIHYYRITVDDGYGSTDFIDFTLTVSETVQIVSTDPTGDFDLDANEAQELTLTLNFNATSVWYVDEIEIQTDHNTTTPDYYFTSTTPGVYNVTCIATDLINGTTDSFTWFITVIDEDAEVPSVPAPMPRYRYEEVTDYISEVWDDAEAGGFGAVIEDVEEVLAEDVSDQNLIWIILICVLLLAYAYYKEQ